MQAKCKSFCLHLTLEHWWPVLLKYDPWLHTSLHTSITMSSYLLTVFSVSPSNVSWFCSQIPSLDCLMGDLRYSSAVIWLGTIFTNSLRPPALHWAAHWTSSPGVLLGSPPQHDSRRPHHFSSQTCSHSACEWQHHSPKPLGHRELPADHLRQPFPCYPLLLSETPGRSVLKWGWSLVSCGPCPVLRSWPYLPLHWPVQFLVNIILIFIKLIYIQCL